ncbi:MAG: hypothetical protein KatS3mg110_1784 [Pirellulaceae bacterium]|nr:MAG: hypothetical protein KatS3mg110_1784 [Pirellulaceae bacterium]
MARLRRCDVVSNGELIRMVCGSTCARQEALIRRDPSRVHEWKERGGRRPGLRDGGRGGRLTGNYWFGSLAAAARAAA